MQSEGRAALVSILASFFFYFSFSLTYAIYLETPPMRVAGGGGHGGGGLLGGGAGGEGGGGEGGGGRSGGGDGGVDGNMLGGGGGGVRLGARERREAQRQRAVDVGVRLRAGVHGP